MPNRFTGEPNVDSNELVDKRPPVEADNDHGYHGVGFRGRPPTVPPLANSIDGKNWDLVNSLNGVDNDGAELPING